MKHTPGPWGIEWKDSGGCAIVPSDGHGKIGNVLVRYSKTDNLVEVGANALLIAAAPELKDQLSAAVDLLSVLVSEPCFGHHVAVISAHIRQYQYAIAKAEGR